MSQRIGLYAGSFDPITNGHVGVMRAAMGLVDRLVVGVGVHPSKTAMFSPTERIAMVRSIAEPLAQKLEVAVEVKEFSNLVIDFARELGAGVLFRGLRDGGDFDYEMQMAGMNQRLAPGLQTVFVPADPEVRHITATLVRQIAQMGGDVSAFVPPAVAAQIRAKFTA